MKTREFDPVLAAALRNELAALPSDAPEARPARHRPQVWTTVVTAVVLVGATIGVLRLTAAHDPQPARVPQVTDPLTRVSDPDDPMYLRNGVWSLLHLSGTGPGTYALDVPEGTTSVRPMIACAPTSDVRITIGDAVVAPCDADGAGRLDDVPVTAGVRPITVAVPEGVRWRLAVIETPQENTTYATFRVTGAPDPAPPVRYPAPQREDDVAVGIAAGGTGTTTGRLFSPVDELALVTSCTGSGGLVITMSNGLRFGTDDAPFTCGPDGRATGAASNDTARGYRDDGRLTYTVRTIGDITWTATFSSRTEERLPYPEVSGALLARVRGSSDASQGRLDEDADRVHAVVTCRGSGTLNVRLVREGGSAEVMDGSPAMPCSDRQEYDVLPEAGTGRLRYDVFPVGDVLWTVTFVRG